MTFVQLSARLKNFLRGWLLVLGIKEGLVECATLCVKSVVILIYCVEVKRKEIVWDTKNYLKFAKLVCRIYCGKTIMSRRKKKLFQCESDKWNRIVQ